MADCNNCTETCPKAELAHETALGRMYATQELVALVKKIEAGELVEVVRCGNCRYFFVDEYYAKHGLCRAYPLGTAKLPMDYCSLGERRET